MANKLGKVDLPFFEMEIFEHTGSAREEVLQGPGFGVDVSLVRLSHGLAMATTSDPLSLVPSLGLEESAWLSVQLMANDMATTGFAPQYGQFVLNLPATFSVWDFRTYWQFIDRFCKDIGVAITGGHTGFVEGQNSTIAGGGTFTAIGPQHLFRLSCFAKEGDMLLVTKQCGLSSSAILALSFPETVRGRVGNDLYNQACETFYQTSSLNDALIAVEGDEERQEVTAMHDVTEGGVLGAIYELASAAGLGVDVFYEQLPVGPVQEAVCHVFGLDPRRCIGAGSMLIACRPEAVPTVTNRLSAQHIDCATVGRLISQKEGMNLQTRTGTQPLVYEPKDPYWHAFFEALKKGWK